MYAPFSDRRNIYINHRKRGNAITQSTERPARASKYKLYLIIKRNASDVIADVWIFVIDLDKNINFTLGWRWCSHRGFARIYYVVMYSFRFCRAQNSQSTQEMVKTGLLSIISIKISPSFHPIGLPFQPELPHESDSYCHEPSLNFYFMCLVN